MSARQRYRFFRPASWLALFAILLQSLVPAIHHPASMALAGATDNVVGGFDLAKNLCVVPGHNAPEGPGKTPAHQLPDCAICQAVHAIGGFVPPVVPALTASSVHEIAFAAFAYSIAPQRWAHSSQQPRAPPSLA